MTLNLNDMVTVTPTARGVALLRAAREHIREPLVAGQPYREQLWVLMAAWGPHIYNGAENVIEGNVITLDAKVTS